MTLLRAVRPLGLALSAGLLFNGCGLSFQRDDDRDGDGSKVKDLAADVRAKNVALFLGAPVNLAGVPIDIRKNDELFKSSDMSFGFEVTSVNKATRQMIVDQTKEAARKVGPGGTLLWYFSGHGAEDGSMYTQDQQFIKFPEIAEAIRSARETPLKRLVVVIDNCFSGTNLQGSGSIIPEGGQYSAANPAQRDASGVAATVAAFEAALASGGGTYAASRLYEQALVITASQASETSQDSDEGGVFSEAWRKVLKELRGRQGATLGDMAEETKRRTRQDSGGGHTPMYKAFPGDQILKEPLFGANPGSGGGTTQPPPASAEIFAALGAADAGGNATLYVAGPTRIAQIALCRGSLAQCWARPTADVAVQAAPEKPIAGMSVFRTSAAMALAAGQPYTVLAYDSSQRLIEARAMQFAPR